MKEKYLPYFILICALGLSLTAAYYSVIGLSILFSGVAVPVIVMGSFLEISKIAIATYLHNQWKKIHTMLKIYLTTALIVLSFITSLGIYGLLSTGFQSNIAKLEITNKQINNIELKKQRFITTKDELSVEKQILTKDISQLRNALSTNTTTQTVDKKTGQISSRENTNNRKAFENQLQLSTTNQNNLSSKIESLNDSITNLDIQILNMESDRELGNELGAVKYVSEITGKPVKQIANIFILLLIFVFDPLAITLIIASNQAFKNLKPVMNIYGEPKTPTPTIIKTKSDPTEEINNIEEELEKIYNSGATQKRKESAAAPLREKIQSLRDNDNIKEY
jgi:hypothetical protein